MQYPILYKKLDDDTIVYWELTISTNEDYCIIDTTRGEYGIGNAVHNMEIVEGNNGTGAQTEAQLRARNMVDYRKQLGYKSLDELSIMRPTADNYTEWRVGVDSYTTLKEALEVVLRG